MDQFSARSFAILTRILERIRKTSAVTIIHQMKTVRNTLEQAKEQFSEIGLGFSVQQVNRMLAYIKKHADKGDYDGNLIIKMVSILQTRIEDELKSSLFLHVSTEKVRYYENMQPFGKEVAEQFSRATGDIEEAAKCFALGRDTASVFHLMRVMEEGLKTLGQVETWGRA